jgi:hypothetical protein
MGEYGGHVPKRIQTKPVETPLINGHLNTCQGIANGRSYDFRICPGCLQHYLEKTTK